MLKPVTTKLREQLEEANDCEPCTPQQDFIHLLNI